MGRFDMYLAGRTRGYHGRELIHVQGFTIRCWTEHPEGNWLSEANGADPTEDAYQISDEDTPLTRQEAERYAQIMRLGYGLSVAMGALPGSFRMLEQAGESIPK